MSGGGLQAGAVGRREARGALAGLALLALGGCCAPPPGLVEPELNGLTVVARGGARVLSRPAELPAPALEALAVELEAVRQQVAARLGVPPPVLEVVVFAPCRFGAQGNAEGVLETLAVSEEGRVRFRYEWDGEDAEGRAMLLGTAAHEAAEAAVLEQVTVIDPYLRWAHDGIAELAELEARGTRDPEASGRLRARALEELARRQRAGAEWLDLTRWRQIAPWVVRSHRFVEEPGNLSLQDLPGSRARVAAARRRARDPGLRGWLDELAAVLDHAEEVAALPERPGEALPQGPGGTDFVFYVAALAYWLRLEEERPGTVARFVQALARARAGDDHVLRAEEAEAALVSAWGGPVPSLRHVDLAWVAEVLTRP